MTGQRVTNERVDRTTAEVTTAAEAIASFMSRHAEANEPTIALTPNQIKTLEGDPQTGWPGLLNMENAALKVDVYLAMAAEGVGLVPGSSEESRARFNLLLDAGARAWQGTEVNARGINAENERGRIGQYAQIIRNVAQSPENRGSLNDNAVGQIRRRTLPAEIADSDADIFVSGDLRLESLRTVRADQNYVALPEDIRRSGVVGGRVDPAGLRQATNAKDWQAAKVNMDAAYERWRVDPQSVSVAEKTAYMQELRLLAHEAEKEESWFDNGFWQGFWKVLLTILTLGMNLLYDYFTTSETEELLELTHKIQAKLAALEHDPTQEIHRSVYGHPIPSRMSAQNDVIPGTDEMWSAAAVAGKLDDFMGGSWDGTSGESRILDITHGLHVLDRVAIAEAYAERRARAGDEEWAGLTGRAALDKLYEKLVAELDDNPLWQTRDGLLIKEQFDPSNLTGQLTPEGVIALNLSGLQFIGIWKRNPAPIMRLLRTSSPAQIRAIDLALRERYKMTLFPQDGDDELGIEDALDKLGDEYKAQGQFLMHAPRINGHVHPSYEQAFQVRQAVKDGDRDEVLRLLSTMSRTEILAMSRAYDEINAVLWHDDAPQGADPNDPLGTNFYAWIHTEFDRLLRDDSLEHQALGKAFQGLRYEPDPTLVEAAAGGDRTAARQLWESEVAHRAIVADFVAVQSRRAGQGELNDDDVMALMQLIQADTAAADRPANGLPTAREVVAAFDAMGYDDLNIRTMLRRSASDPIEKLVDLAFDGHGVTSAKGTAVQLRTVLGQGFMGYFGPREEQIIELLDRPGMTPEQKKAFVEEVKAEYAAMFGGASLRDDIAKHKDIAEFELPNGSKVVGRALRLVDEGNVSPAWRLVYARAWDAGFDMFGQVDGQLIMETLSDMSPLDKVITMQMYADILGRRFDLFGRNPQNPLLEDLHRLDNDDTGLAPFIASLMPQDASQMAFEAALFIDAGSNEFIDEWLRHSGIDPTQWLARHYPDMDPDEVGIQHPALTRLRRMITQAGGVEQFASQVSMTTQEFQDSLLTATQNARGNAALKALVDLRSPIGKHLEVYQRKVNAAIREMDVALRELENANPEDKEAIAALEARIIEAEDRVKQHTEEAIQSLLETKEFGIDTREAAAAIATTALLIGAVASGAPTWAGLLLTAGGRAGTHALLGEDRAARLFIEAARGGFQYMITQGAISQMTAVANEPLGIRTVHSFFVGAQVGAANTWFYNITTPQNWHDGFMRGLGYSTRDVGRNSLITGAFSAGMTLVLGGFEKMRGGDDKTPQNDGGNDGGDDGGTGDTGDTTRPPGGRDGVPSDPPTGGPPGGRDSVPTTGDTGGPIGGRDPVGGNVGNVNTGGPLGGRDLPVGTLGVAEGGYFTPDVATATAVTNISAVDGVIITPSMPVGVAASEIARHDAIAMGASNFVLVGILGIKSQEYARHLVATGQLPDDAAWTRLLEEAKGLKESGALPADFEIPEHPPANRLKALRFMIALREAAITSAQTHDEAGRVTRDRERIDGNRTERDRERVPTGPEGTGAQRWALQQLKAAGTISEADQVKLDVYRFLELAARDIASSRSEQLTQLSAAERTELEALKQRFDADGNIDVAELVQQHGIDNAAAMRTILEGQEATGAPLSAREAARLEAFRRAEIDAIVALSTSPTPFQLERLTFLREKLGIEGNDYDPAADAERTADLERQRAADDAVDPRLDRAAFDRWALGQMSAAGTPLTEAQQGTLDAYRAIELVALSNTRQLTGAETTELTSVKEKLGLEGEVDVAALQAQHGISNDAAHRAALEAIVSTGGSISAEDTAALRGYRQAEIAALSALGAGATEAEKARLGALQALVGDDGATTESPSLDRAAFDRWALGEMAKTGTLDEDRQRKLDVFRFVELASVKAATDLRDGVAGLSTEQEAELVALAQKLGVEVGPVNIETLRALVSEDLGLTDQSVQRTVLEAIVAAGIEPAAEEAALLERLRQQEVAALAALGANITPAETARLTYMRELLGIEGNDYDPGADAERQAELDRNRQRVEGGDDRPRIPRESEGGDFDPAVEARRLAELQQAYEVSPRFAGEDIAYLEEHGPSAIEWVLNRAAGSMGEMSVADRVAALNAEARFQGDGTSIRQMIRNDQSHLTSFGRTGAKYTTDGIPDAASVKAFENAVAIFGGLVENDRALVRANLDAYNQRMALVAAALETSIPEDATARQLQALLRRYQTEILKVQGTGVWDQNTDDAHVGFQEGVQAEREAAEAAADREEKIQQARADVERLLSSMVGGVSRDDVIKMVQALDVLRNSAGESTEAQTGYNVGMSTLRGKLSADSQATAEFIAYGVGAAEQNQTLKEIMGQVLPTFSPLETEAISERLVRMGLELDTVPVEILDAVDNSGGQFSNAVRVATLQKKDVEKIIGEDLDFFVDRMDYHEAAKVLRKFDRTEHAAQIGTLAMALLRRANAGGDQATRAARFLQYGLADGQDASLDVTADLIYRMFQRGFEGGPLDGGQDDFALLLGSTRRGESTVNGVHYTSYKFDGSMARLRRDTSLGDRNIRNLAAYEVAYALERGPGLYNISYSERSLSYYLWGERDGGQGGMFGSKPTRSFER